MGFIDFIKKVFSEKQEMPDEKDTISFENLVSWVESKKNNLDEKDSTATKQVQELVSKLIEELKREAEALKEIDLSDKKEPEKIKLIVKENLYYFSGYIDKLILGLESLKYSSLANTRDSINIIFSSFEKRSIRSYQKATILVGKELREVTNSISNFFRSLKQITEENTKLIDELKILEIIKIKTDELEKLEKEEEKINNSISGCDSKIKSLEEEILKINKKIDEIKEGEEYLEFLKTKEQIEEEKAALINKINELKLMIDFKALASVYHSAEKKMKLLKEYRDNFREAFEKYSKEIFFELMDINAIDKESIKKKIEEIENIKESLKNIKIKEDPTKSLVNEIDRVKFRMVEVENTISRHKKLNLRIKEKEEKIKEEVKKELEKINLDIAS